MSNKPQVLPWDPDAVIQFPSGMVARFDGGFWHQDGQMFTHRQFQQELEGVPFVRLFPATTTEKDSYKAGQDSALYKVKNALYYAMRKSEDPVETNILVNAIKIVEAIDG